MEQSERAWILVTLHNWLETQVQQDAPHHAELQAAMDANDPGAFRRALADAPFSPGQRRYFDDLVLRWQHLLESDP